MTTVISEHTAFIHAHRTAFNPPSRRANRGISDGFLGAPELSPYSPPVEIAKGLLNHDGVNPVRSVAVWRAARKVAADATSPTGMQDFQYGVQDDIHGERTEITDEDEELYEVIDTIKQLRKLARLGMVVEVPLVEQEGETGLDRKFYRTDSPGWELVDTILELVQGDRTTLDLGGVI